MIDTYFYKKVDIYELNKAFITACEKGKIEDIKYLLTSTDLKQNVDIHLNENAGLRTAADYRQNEVVRYLLTSSDLKEHADINAHNDYPFYAACQTGNLELIKFLLESPELSKYADIHADDDYGFQVVCQTDRQDIIQYFIIDKNFTISPTLQLWLEGDNQNKEKYEKVLKIIAIRELNKKLDDKLEKKDIIIKKHKV